MVAPIFQEATIPIFYNTLCKIISLLELLVQPRTSDDMSVEDSMTEWDPVQAPFIPVATIHIPKQAFDTPERRAFGENLSFTPWHSLPEHRQAPEAAHVPWVSLTWPK